MADNNKLQAMMAQLQGALKQGKPVKPRVSAEPAVEEPQRGVGPTPGKVKGIDDVETREGTKSEIAELAEKASEKTGVQDVPQPDEVSGPLEEDPELAELLESIDDTSSQLGDNSEAEALMSEPDDPMEAVTQESKVSRPREDDSGIERVEQAIEDALAEPDEAVVSGSEVESAPPSAMEALEEEQERESAATVSAVAAKVMEQMGAMVDEKLAPLRKQLDELKASVESTVSDVNDRMGRLAESTVGMDTFNSFFMEDFAPALEAMEKVEAMSGQIDRIEEDLKGVNNELSGDEGTVATLSKELDALKSRVENDTVTSEMWNTFLEEEYLPVAELRDQLEELNLPVLAKAWMELSSKWDALVGPDGERIPGMVHAHREASIVVAVEILRNTTEQNFHRLQDFVSDYGQNWVKDVMSYLAENPEVVKDKVALIKYNVIYDHMAASDKLQSFKPKVDAEVQRVIGFAKQLTGDS